MMDWYGVGAGGWLMMIVAMTAFWGLVVVVGLMVLRGGVWEQRRRSADLLDERFARGEIDRDEYESRRDALDDRRR